MPTRRTFLTTAVGTTAGAIGVGWWALDTQRAAAGPGQSAFSIGRWRIEAVRIDQAFADGTTVPYFRFRALGRTPSAGELPLIAARQGTAVSLSVTNTLDFDIQPQIVGVLDGPVIAPGATRRMTFRMPAAGTYLLTEMLLGPAGGPVGFGAMVVSRPVPQSAYGPSAWDREYMLLYQDTDDRWNLDLDAGVPLDTSIYEPNYHTVNGLTFPATATDPDCRIVCNVGENVLLRFGNLGRLPQAIHFHGYHAEILARNNVPETMLPAKDTFALPAYTTAEVLLPVAQPGVFPLHPHSLTTVTDNGLYPHGQILLIEAT